MSVPIFLTDFHPTLCRTYHSLCTSVRQPITDVKAMWNVAADVWKLSKSCDNVGLQKEISH